MSIKIDWWIGVNSTQEVSVNTYYQELLIVKNPQSERLSEPILRYPERYSASLNSRFNNWYNVSQVNVLL